MENWHAAAPLSRRIVRRHQLQIADTARPLEGAEDDIVGGEQLLAAQEGLRPQR